MDLSFENLYFSNMSDQAFGPSVLNYNLFGEAGDLPDVVHIETIEVRSLLHDWEFAPHRHGRLHQVLLIEAGGGRLELDGRTTPLHSMHFVNVPMGTIHGYSFEPATRGWVLTIASEMMEEALEPSSQLRRILAQPAIGKAEPPLNDIMEDIAIEFDRREFGRAQALRSLSGLLLGRVARILARAEDKSLERKVDRRFSALLELIEAHYVDEWSVSAYASALGITPVHLTRICRSATGKSASKLIDERVIHEARRNLAYTNLPISSIGYSLGFSDPAYFSRVFSRVTGMSPRKFRDQLAAGGKAEVI